MFKKFDKLLPIFTLCITMLLLIVVVCAWYVENEIVTADGVVGSTSGPDVELYVTTYSLTKDGDAYIKGEEIDDMFDYNNLEHKTTAILIVIEYKFNNGVSASDYRLSLNTDINYVISDDTYNSVDIEGTAVDERKLAFQTNYLSNTISFYQDVTLSNGKFEIGKSAKKYSFVNKNTITNKYDKKTENELSITIVKNENLLNYVILDYDADYINYLYQEMVSQCEGATLNESMTYNEDLYVTLLEE